MALLETRSLGAAFRVSTRRGLRWLSLAGVALCLGAAEGQPVTLSWNDNSENESGFKIERSTDNLNFVEIAVVGEDVTEYEDTSALVVGQFYAYRVRAFNEHGNSGYANTATTRYDPEPDVYFGEFESGAGSFGILVRVDGSGVFLGAMNGIANGGIATAEFRLAEDGSFAFSVANLGAFQGVVGDGVVSAGFEAAAEGGGGLSIAGGMDFLEGTLEARSGTSVRKAGLFDSGVDTSAGARVLVLTGPNGKGLVVASLDGEASSIVVEVAENGRAEGVFADGARLSFELGGIGDVLSGSLSRNGEVVDFAGRRQSALESVLANASFRSPVKGGATISAGFVVLGSGRKEVLIRAVGPGLAGWGVTNPVGDPNLVLYRQGSEGSVGENDRWGSDQMGLIESIGDQVGAFPLEGGSADAAMVVSVEEGLYWIQVKNQGPSLGTVLVELYDIDTLTGGFAESALVNISLRAEVTSNADPLIAGYVVSGPVSRGLLVRAMGREMERFGVTRVMPDPLIEVFAYGDSVTPIARSDDWTEDRELLVDLAGQVGAFAFENGSRSSAKAMWLEPNLYTVVAKSADGRGGEVLLELYTTP